MSRSQRTVPVPRNTFTAWLFAFAAVSIAVLDAGVRTLMAVGLSKNAAGTGVTLVAVVAGLTAAQRLARAAFDQ